MAEFFVGIQSLGFWQWIGLILLAAVLRGAGPILASRRTVRQ